MDYAPRILDVEIVGTAPVLGAGSSVTLRAVTAHSGGDSLTFTWFTGDGDESHFSNHDHTNHTVSWSVPAGVYGEVDVTCVATDLSGDEVEFVEDFEVGLSIDDWDTVPPDAGNVITWETGHQEGEIPFFIINGTVTIPDTLTLKIEPGAEIYCRLNSVIQAKTLEIGDSEGSDQSQVSFKPYTTDDTGNALWSGITILTGGSAEVYRANFYHAGNAFKVVTGNVELMLSGCLFDSCQRGVNLYGASVTLESCTFSECNFGADLLNCPSIDLEYCNFSKNIDYGLKCSAGTEGEVTNSTFNENAGPGVTMAGPGYVAFNDNNFLGTSLAFLIGADFPSDPPIDLQCNYWGNSTVSIPDRIDIDNDSVATVDYQPNKALSNSPCTPDD